MLKNFPPLMSFKGRINRLQFLALLIIMLVLGSGAGFLLQAILGGASNSVAMIAGLIILAILTVWSTSAVVRRGYDLGFDAKVSGGLWIAIVLIRTGLEIGAASLSGLAIGALIASVAQLGFLIFLLIRKGQTGENAYGPDPSAKESENAA